MVEEQAVASALLSIFRRRESFRNDDCDAGKGHCHSVHEASSPCSVEDVAGERRGGAKGLCAAGTVKEHD